MALEQNTQNLRELIRKRATIKSKLTSFARFVVTCRDSEDIPLSELELRTARLEKEFDTFDSIQNALELSASDEEYEIRLTERNDFEDNYYSIVATAKDIIKKHNNLSGQVDGSPQVPHALQPSGLPEATNFQSPLTVVSESHVKLPTMHLPKFSGSYEAWPGFADAFKSAIHENPSFRDAQKLIYLKSCLSGKAAEKVESLETTAANYAVAWDILDKYYNDPSVVINNRVQAFFDLPSCPRSNPTALGELTDTATKHYNALKALNKPFLEAFPIYAITSKLDDESRLRWKEKTQGVDFPSMEELLDFLHKRRRVLESTNVEPVKPIARTPSTTNTKTRSINTPSATTRSRVGPVTRNCGSSNTTVSSHAYSVQQARCNLCKANHFTQYCSNFTAANIDQRKEMIRKAGLCTNCLRPNHEAKDCVASCCKQCNGKHHTLLHKEQKPVQANVSALSANTASETLLSTAIVYIRDKHNRPQPCRILLDSGSQSHFLTERFAKKLSLPLQKANIPVVGINQTISQIQNSLRTSVQSRINKFTTDLTFLILPHITEILPSRPITKEHLDIPANIPLADPNFNIPSEVDGLIGAEVFLKLLCVGQIVTANESITLQKTRLGWVLAGTVPAKQASAATHCHVTCHALENCIMKFWELEEPLREVVLSAEEQACENHFTESTTRESDSGRYVVKLPFRSRPPTLGNSYTIALRRFHALERTLNKNTALKHDYVKFLNEYRDLGHMEMQNSPNTQIGYYLPHHAVLKHDSLTTKLRVVFDASAKSSNGASLNDTLLTGPTIQEELYTLLIRFRSHTYVLTADIEKMYRQVRVHPQDRIYQKILWRENPNQPLKTYTLNTVTYGTSAAPFLATRAMHQLAADEGEQYPRAARVLREDFYVDDLLTGADSYLEAAAILSEITALCAKGGFRLRQWATNNESLINALQHEQTQKRNEYHSTRYNTNKSRNNRELITRTS